MTHPIIIIGGQAAGMSAAMQLRRRDTRISIQVFEQGDAVSYAACGLPFLLNGVVCDPAVLFGKTVAEFRQNFGVDVHLQSEVTSILPSKHSVVVRYKEQTTHEFPYSRLIIASGAQANIPRPFMTAMPGVRAFRQMDDALSLHHTLQCSNSGDVSLAIIGAGPLGVLLASVLSNRSIRVFLIEQTSRVLSLWEKSISEQVSQHLVNAGVQIITDVQVQRVETVNGIVSGVLLNNGNMISVNNVVLASGVHPATTWLQGTGIKLNSNGTILINRNMETSCKDVFAAGDCTEAFHRILRRHAYLPHGTTANRQGQCVADNALGRRIEFAGTCGARCMKIQELEIARTGLTERDIQAEGIDSCRVMIDHLSRSHYYPGAEGIRVIMFADRKMNRVIGCEMIGKEGVSKRIDIVTTALIAGMSPRELASVDFSYSPPLSPEKDPVLLAALLLDKEMSR